MRKDRHAEWARLSASRKPKPPAVRVLDLRGVRAMEDKLFLYTSHRGPLSPDIEDALHELSASVFGITRPDTEFEWPVEYWEYDVDSLERWKIEQWHAEHERKFETEGLSDEDSVAVLQRLGLDFTNDRGEPLRCMRWLRRQAESAAKGFGGTMPDRSEADLNVWEKSLAFEAEMHLRRKKR